MKKFILILLVINLILPVYADTVIFTNGQVKHNCNFVDNNTFAYCREGTWGYYTDCLDNKKMCISELKPDSSKDLKIGKLDRFLKSFNNPSIISPNSQQAYNNNSGPMFLFPNYAGGYYGMQGSHQVMLNPNGAGGFYGYSF